MLRVMKFYFLFVLFKFYNWYKFQYSYLMERQLNPHLNGFFMSKTVDFN